MKKTKTRSASAKVRVAAKGKTTRRAAAASRTRAGSKKNAAEFKGDLKYIPWRDVEMEQLNSLLRRQFVVGQEIMLARVLMKKGCVVPEHSHHNEQITYIVEGALKFWVDGREIIVSEGETLLIPSNMPHRAEALKDTVDLDVFTPPRADWIGKTDSYLRGQDAATRR